MSACINNFNESSTTKINKHTPSSYSIFTSCSFDEPRNKLNYYRGKDCMKKFYKDLREHATRIINYEKKKIIALPKQEKINYNDQQICYICKKEFDTIDTAGPSSLEHKKNYTIRDHCHYMGKYRGAAHNICNLRYKVPKEIPVVFHNGSTYGYQLTIKELVKEFEGNFDCLGENTETCITFSVPLKKKIENKDLEITYKIKFIDKFRSSSSLSKLVEPRNKLNYYRGKDCMKKFCKDLREHATRIINYEKKKIIALTKQEKINYNDQQICYICKKEFDTIDTAGPSSLERKKNYKVRDHCHYTGKYRGAAHNICNLRYKVPKEIPVVFHNGSTYDYQFIIKELVKEFEGNFDCLGENTETCITFSVPLKKKIENKNLEITYKIKFIDSFRSSSSLFKLVDNLFEEAHNNKCSDFKSNLDYVCINKNKKLLLECFNCNIYYKKKFNNDLIKKFKNTYSFCNNNTTGSSSLERINKFVLLLRKGVYPYEYMDNWERFSEISLPSKKDFYSNLNMEDISDIDYRHANNVFKVFKLENLGDYYDLYVNSDTLSLADVFNNFRDMCIKECELDPAHFLSLPGLAWQACLKKN